MRSQTVSQTHDSGKIELGPNKPIQYSYLMLMRLPDAQTFPPEYGISYAQSRLSHLGVKVDRSFKIDPHVEGGYVTYTLRADMTPAQAKAAEKLGFTVERDREVHAQPAG